MAQWIYRIVPTRPEMVAAPTERETEIVRAHFRCLVDLRDRGILILADRTQESVDTWGITIFEADDALSFRLSAPARGHAPPGAAPCR